MLRFGQSSEVTEAIKFIVACRMFNVPGSQSSVHELCRLIWRNDAAIKEAVVNACNQLFLSTGTEFVPFFVVLIIAVYRKIPVLLEDVV